MTVVPNLSITLRQRFIKMTLFVLLLGLMVVSAHYLKDNAAFVLANADPIIPNEQLCYSSCTFTRPISAIMP
jgi:hypothetical protein